MEAVFDTLERLLREGILTDYAIGGATAVGIHGEQRARLAYLARLPDFDRPRFLEILARHNLRNRWDQWAAALDL